MDEQHTDAYDYCMRLVRSSTMPVCIPIDGELHIVGLQPTNREGLVSMINPDDDERLRFIVACAYSMGTQIREKAEL